MAVVDITSLATISEYRSEDYNITETQKYHLIEAIRMVQKYAVKTKTICHTPKIKNGKMQLGLDL